MSHCKLNLNFKATEHLICPDYKEVQARNITMQTAGHHYSYTETCTQHNSPLLLLVVYNNLNCVCVRVVSAEQLL